MNDVVTVLCIEDEADGLHVASDAPTTVVRLSDFEYCNSTPDQMTELLERDLARLGGLPSTLRDQAFARIVSWTSEKSAMLHAHYPDLASGFDTAVARGSAIWAASAPAEAAAAYEQAQAAR